MRTPLKKAVRRITQVRSEYTSARVIATNLDHRLAGSIWRRPPGYIPPEIDYADEDGLAQTIAVRDYDVRYLDRVPPSKAAEHINLIHLARGGAAEARAELAWRTAETQRSIAGRFVEKGLVENGHVIPYTTSSSFPDTAVSNKGGILLDLSQRGFATADFVLLSSSVYQLPPEEREARLWEAIRDLEILSGRTLADPDNPLLIAMRSAMPEYVPGFMPTFLNVGLTPELLPGLPPRYGEEGAARIRLNSRKTILEALEPETFRLIEYDVKPEMTIDQNLDLARRIEALIENRNPKLLWSASEQVKFFLSRIYGYYERHLDALSNFLRADTHTPAVIVQRMVCSVIDRKSYAGVLYSRHPRLGSGVFLQYARAVYGEDLMTGRLQAEERHFKTREEARREFPAVYHFWPRLEQLEGVFQAPVMVEFTGVHGTFTILQVNPAEMVGAGMLSAVMDMHRAGRIQAGRVRELVKPYHVRQIESDAIDSKSLHSLTPFCRGISVLPRAAVTGRIFFSAERAAAEREAQGGGNAILAKDRFTPVDAMDLTNMAGILSLSPAAIHVVTTAQNLGIPALLNLEEDGVRLDPEKRILINRDKKVVQEGDWISISSRLGTLYLGRAVFAPARLLRFMAGEKVELAAAERSRFETLADYYREYRRIVESVGAAEFASLQDLGHAICYGRLRDDRRLAEEFVNRSYDLNRETVVARMMSATLGTHLINRTAFDLLTADRQVNLLKSVLALAGRRGRWGYQAGAFLIGSLVTPASRVAFWKSFTPGELARLINEWILHQKYLKILDDLGERKVSRAKDVILTRGLGALAIHKGTASEFMTLKLSGLDLPAIRREAGEGFDPQTSELLVFLEKPFGEFFDFSDETSLGGLRRICAAENLPLPGADES